MSDPTEAATGGGVDTVTEARIAAPGLGDWWDEVSTCVLVGTGRRPVPATPAALLDAARLADGSDPCASGPSAAVPGTDTETRLLDLVALGTAWRNGAVEAARPDPLPPAPEETRPVAPLQALAILELILAHTLAVPDATGSLVGEWVATAQAHGVRVPPARIPALLDHAAALLRPDPHGPGRDAADAILAVTGERGVWLARLTPQWQELVTHRDTGAALPGAAPPDTARPDTARPDAAPPDTAPPDGRLPDDWLQRPLAEQVALLGRLRASAPELAREAVAEGYRSGSARERVAYVGVLSEHLGTADEDLLEHALADRAGGVREVAARLLERLPDSARAARMGERLRPLVGVTTRFLRRRVVVELPDPPDAMSVRDGVGKPPRARSVRGHHLTEIVSGAPLSLWEELTGLPPEGLLAALQDPGDVRQGLRRAAIAQRDPEWARALLVHDRVHPGLLAILDPADAERLVAERLAQVPPDSGEVLLTELPGPWGPDLSTVALDHLMRSRHRNDAARVIAAVGDRIHPTCLPALQAAVERLPFGAARDRASGTVALATLRQSISEAFT